MQHKVIQIVDTGRYLIEQDRPIPDSDFVVAPEWMQLYVNTGVKPDNAKLLADSGCRITELNKYMARRRKFDTCLKTHFGSQLLIFNEDMPIYQTWKEIGSPIVLQPVAENDDVSLWYDIAGRTTCLCDGKVVAEGTSCVQLGEYIGLSPTRYLLTGHLAKIVR